MHRHSGDTPCHRRMLAIVAWLVACSASVPAKVTAIEPPAVKSLALDAVVDGADSAAPEAANSTADNASWVALFDGQSLAGWEGEARWFRIEDETIIAGSLQQSIPRNYFLCTTRPYGDFELRLQVKVVGDNANAGVQFRTARLEGSTEVSGYQADVGAVGDRLVWGSLYDESRRNRFLAEADRDQINRLVRRDDWNDYRIRCQGNRIELFINGEKTIAFDETDAAIAGTGVIALQIHSGPPTEAHYRKIMIREF